MENIFVTNKMMSKKNCNSDKIRVIYQYQVFTSNLSFFIYFSFSIYLSFYICIPFCFYTYLPFFFYIPFFLFIPHWLYLFFIPIFIHFFNSFFSIAHYLKELLIVFLIKYIFYVQLDNDKPDQNFEFYWILYSRWK